MVVPVNVFNLDFVLRPRPFATLLAMPCPSSGDKPLQSALRPSLLGLSRGLSTPLAVMRRFLSRNTRLTSQIIGAVLNNVTSRPAGRLPTLRIEASSTFIILKIMSHNQDRDGGVDLITHRIHSAAYDQPNRESLS